MASNRKPVAKGEAEMRSMEELLDELAAGGRVDLKDRQRLRVEFDRAVKRLACEGVELPPLDDMMRAWEKRLRKKRGTGSPDHPGGGP